MNDQEARVLRAFRERLAQGDLKGDMRITYLLSGGAPGTRLMEKVEISADGPTHTEVRDERKQMPSEKRQSTIGRGDVEMLYRLVEQGVEALTPTSEARFVPDSVVGSITLEVGKDTATFYFLADESERIELGVKLPAPISRAILEIERIEKRLLEKSDRPPGNPSR